MIRIFSRCTESSEPLKITLAATAATFVSSSLLFSRSRVLRLRGTHHLPHVSRLINRLVCLTLRLHSACLYTACLASSNVLRTASRCFDTTKPMYDNRKRVSGSDAINSQLEDTKLGNKSLGNRLILPFYSIIIFLISRTCAAELLYYIAHVVKFNISIRVPLSILLTAIPEK